MKICFLIPPALDGRLPAERIFGCNYGIYNQPNLFILYLATFLRTKGHEVFFKDCVIERIKIRGFEQFIDSDDSDLYFFCTVFLSKITDLKAREMIKKRRNNARFVYFSTEPTANPKDFLDEDSFVIRGEPEYTAIELVAALEKKAQLSGIKGIVYQNQLGIIDTGYREPIENLDVLPIPDRSLLPKGNYNNPKLSTYPFTTVLTSRGCPYKCYYCVPNSLSFCREIDYKKSHDNEKKPPFRSRSVDNVVKEIKMLSDQGYRSFSIIDDLFAYSPKWVIEFCRKIEELNMEWSCLSRADHMTDTEMVLSMGRAGCRYVDMGIESFNKKILDYIEKNLDLSTVPLAVKNLKKAGIEIELNVLLASCELETEETIIETYNALKKLDVDYVLFSACTPFPYTKFNRIAKEKNWMIEPEYRPIDPIKSSFVSFTHLPKNKIEKLLRKLYVGFYYRPSYIWKRLLKLKSPQDFYNKSKAALSILR